MPVLRSLLPLANKRMRVWIRYGPASEMLGGAMSLFRLEISPQRAGETENRETGRGTQRDRENDGCPSHRHLVCPLIHRTAETWVSGRFSAGRAQTARVTPPGEQIDAQGQGWSNPYSRCLGSLVICGVRPSPWSLSYIWAGLGGEAGSGERGRVSPRLFWVWSIGCYPSSPGVSTELLSSTAHRQFLAEGAEVSAS